jgi:threonine/homoserine/homoserine lactone efflux protein
VEGPPPPPDLLAVALQGAALGWSVAWIPGPVNAEMLRRGLEGGIRASLPVGLGATSADFCWALLATTGLGAVAGAPAVRTALAGASLALLLVLGGMLLRDGWRAWRAAHAGEVAPAAPAGPPPTGRGGWLLGFTMAALSPFNLAFWVMAFGALQARGIRGGGASLALAAGVTSGALAWCALLCGAVAAGARFAGPRWQAGTRLLSAALLLGFAASLVPALGW